MTHTLRIKGVDYKVVRFVHRRLARSAWAISLPGYEKLFEDKTYGGTQAALDAAMVDIQPVMQLDPVHMLKDCSLELCVRRSGERFEVGTTVNTAIFLSRLALNGFANNNVLAEQLYDVNCSVLLNSREAKVLLGDKEHERFVSQWLKSLRNYIYVENITRVNLAATVETTPPVAKTAATLPPLKALDREFWWNDN